MHRLPTVRIAAPGGRCVVINEADYRPGRHVLWSDTPPLLGALMMPPEVAPTPDMADDVSAPGSRDASQPPDSAPVKRGRGRPRKVR